MKLLHSLLTPTDRKDRTTQRHQMPQGMESHGTYDSAGIHLPIVKTKNSKRYLHMAVAMLMGTVSTVALADSNCVNSTVPGAAYSDWAQGSNNGTINAPHDLTITGSMNNVGGDASGSINSTSPKGGNLFIWASMKSKNDNNDLKLNFNKPVKNLNFSVYDIDRKRRTSWSPWTYIDKVEFIGKNKEGDIVYPTLKNKGSNVSITGSHNNIAYASDGECGTYDFDTNCRITAEFTEEISELQILYGNTNDTRSNPGSQNIEMTFDSYCVSDTDTTPPPIESTEPVIECPAETGWMSDRFANSDYETLLSQLGLTPSNGTTTQYNYIEGVQSESYLNARMKAQFNGIQQENNRYIYTKKEIGSLGNKSLAYVYQNQKVSSSSGYSILEYEFKNKFDETSQELDNFTVSVYDIDYNDGSYLDQVTITGFSKSGAPVYPQLVSKGSGVLQGSNSVYYAKDNQGDNLCRDSKSPFNDRCRVTVKFPLPIVKYQVKYTNISGSGFQEIYSKIDGYCYKPQPRLSFSKVLSGDRIKDTDQFTVKVTKQGNDHAVHDTTHTTTQGEGNTIVTDTGTTGKFKVVPDTIYTLKEEAAGSTDLINYTATYKCTNKDGSEIESSNPLNLKAFEMTYGQEWTCTVTNTPKVYNFSGTVFNDNGGINDVSEADPTALGGVYNNDKYFNGQLDDGEKGIYESGLKVSLTDCDNNNIIRTVDVSSSGSNIGKYAISLPKSELNGATQVCLVEHTGDDLNENLQTYNIDTSPNSITIPLNTNPEQLEYPNKNFGNVIEKNTALVLVKRQYFHDCNKSMPEIQSAEVDPIGGPTAGFSKDTIKNDQGEASSIGIKQCISYRIDAYNRGFVDLTQVVIKDTLPDRSILTTPLPHSPDSITFSDSSVAENQNGQVITNPFTLPKRTNNLTRKAIFFNTNFNN